MFSVPRLIPGTLFAAALVALLPACNGGGGSSSINDSPSASTFAPDVATGWFDLLYSNVKSTSTAPPPPSRIYGYASLALYESIVRGMSDHQTLQGQLVSFPAGTIPEPVNAPHNWPIVANRALAVVAASFFPASQVSIDALEDANLATYQSTVSQAVVDRSVQYGEDVANAILTWSAGDGFSGLAACNGAFVAPLDPSSGGWVPTGPNQGVGAFPCWGTLRTFAVTDSNECPPVGPPAYSTSNTSAYYGQALVVYGTTGDAGASLTTDQADIARFWADNAGATGTPGGHWISIVRVLAEANALKLDVVAEAYARVGLAIHDAFITCWRSKYDVYLQRPVTYIQANIDPTWDPLLGTPGFPAYTSGHSTQSGAAATVLTGQFGPVAFTDTTHTDLNPGLALADRSFANFFDAANEAAVSRLYGGIHWPFDNQDGFNQGQCVGEIINTRIHFQN